MVKKPSLCTPRGKNWGHVLLSCPPISKSSLWILTVLVMRLCVRAAKLYISREESSLMCTVSNSRNIAVFQPWVQARPTPALGHLDGVSGGGNAVCVCIYILRAWWLSWRSINIVSIWVSSRLIVWRDLASWFRAPKAICTGSTAKRRKVVVDAASWEASTAWAC